MNQLTTIHNNTEGFNTSMDRILFVFFGVLVVPYYVIYTFNKFVAKFNRFTVENTVIIEKESLSSGTTTHCLSVAVFKEIKKILDSEYLTDTLSVESLTQMLRYIGLLCNAWVLYMFLLCNIIVICEYIFCYLWIETYMYFTKINH